MGSAYDKVHEFANSVAVKPHTKVINGKLVKVKGHLRDIDFTPQGDAIPRPPKFDNALDAERFLKRYVGEDSDLSPMWAQQFFSKAEMEAVNDIVQRTVEIMNKYPTVRTPKPGLKLGRPFKGIRTYDSDGTPRGVRIYKDGAWASTAGNTLDEDSTSLLIWIQSGGAMLYDGLEAAHNERSRYLDGSTAPLIAGATPGEGIVHELGHVVAHNNGLKDDPSAFMKIADDIWGGENDQLAKDVSVYAMSNPQEAFAEIFLLINTPSRMEQLPKAAQARIKKFADRVNAAYGKVL